MATASKQSTTKNWVSKIKVYVQAFVLIIASVLAISIQFIPQVIDQNNYFQDIDNLTLINHTMSFVVALSFVILFTFNRFIVSLFLLITIHFSTYYLIITLAQKPYSAKTTNILLLKNLTTSIPIPSANFNHEDLSLNNDLQTLSISESLLNYHNKNALISYNSAINIWNDYARISKKSFPSEPVQESVANKYWDAFEETIMLPHQDFIKHQKLYDLSLDEINKVSEDIYFAISHYSPIVVFQCIDAFPDCSSSNPQLKNILDTYHFIKSFKKKDFCITTSCAFTKNIITAHIRNDIASKISSTQKTFNKNFYLTHSQLLKTVTDLDIVKGAIQALPPKFSPKSASIDLLDETYFKNTIMANIAINSEINLISNFSKLYPNLINKIAHSFPQFVNHLSKYFLNDYLYTSLNHQSISSPLILKNELLSLAQDYRDKDLSLIKSFQSKTMDKTNPIYQSYVLINNKTILLTYLFHALGFLLFAVIIRLRMLLV